MYVPVSVREEDVPAFYEWALARLAASPRVDAAATATVASEAAVDEVARRDVDAAARQARHRLYPECTYVGMDVLDALAERAPADFENADELQAAAGVPNVGAALQSVAIQLQKEPLAAPLVEKRMGNGGRNRYRMSPEAAADILDVKRQMGR